MASWQHDPALNYNFNMLKDIGTQQYTSGRDTTNQGMLDLQGPNNFYKRGMSGDTDELMSQSAPQIDAIGQQFKNVRNMISGQPRGGGKTSALAQLPVEQIRMITNLLGQTRQNAAQGTERIANQEINTGMGEKGIGLEGSSAAANIAMGGRNTDIASSWKSFFKDYLKSAAAGAGQAAGAAMMGG